MKARTRKMSVRDNTKRNIHTWLKPVQEHSRTVVINAVNQCIQRPTRKPAILKELAETSPAERDIVAKILSVVVKKPLDLDEFIKE